MSTGAKTQCLETASVHDCIQEVIRLAYSEGIPHISVGSLQLVVVVAPCTTAVKSACDGFLKSFLRS